MYEPAIKIPLLICEPGQSTSREFFTPTGNVDLLPTLLSIAGKDIPMVLDGRVLPGFGGDENSERAIYSMYAAQNSVFLPLRKAAISMHKGPYKLTGYFGYSGYDNVYELYNLQDDPEEMRDLSQENPVMFERMKNELLSALADANRPYEAK